ncbi:MAG: hypothetical protein M3040_05170, partial [Bacteroidota bacterium]|nr:hypothetical protein [Bacteroidota bacterium]
MKRLTVFGIKRSFYPLLLLLLSQSACNNHQQKQRDDGKADTSFQSGTFGYDLNFLKQHDSVVVLQAAGENAKVIVSPKYQAKVFTSTATGDEGKSFGWVNY